MQNVDKWSFDVFALNDASGDHALKFIFYELLTRYDLISRFKVKAQRRTTLGGGGGGGSLCHLSKENPEVFDTKPE